MGVNKNWSTSIKYVGVRGILEQGLSEQETKWRTTAVDHGMSCHQRGGNRIDRKKLLNLRAVWECTTIEHNVRLTVECTDSHQSTSDRQDDTTHADTKRGSG
jgi:hypothetical protein